MFILRWAIVVMVLAFAVCAVPAQEMPGPPRTQDTIESTRAKKSYDYLTDSEQKRVDRIREKLNQTDLQMVGPGSNSGLSRRELEWAWNGEGHDALMDDLLQAAIRSNSIPKESIDLFKLTPSQIVEYSTRPPKELLSANLHAQWLQDETKELPDRVLQKWREDPLLKPLVEARIKRQRAATVAPVQVDK